MAIQDLPGIAGYTELRRDLMHLADEWNKKRLELIELQKTFSEGITQLVLAADKIFTKSLAERTADGGLKKEFTTPTNDSTDKIETDVQAVADHIMPSRRNCGLCGKPGHRRDNCPNADKIISEEREAKEEKIAKREAKAAKPKRKLSPERKAQLVETLKKARAARKGKK